MTPRIPVHNPDGTCTFCQARTRHGGEPHAPGCAYWQALMDITQHRMESVEQAAAMLAELRMAAKEYWVVSGFMPTPTGACSHCGSRDSKHREGCAFVEPQKKIMRLLGMLAL